MDNRILLAVSLIIAGSAFFLFTGQEDSQQNDQFQPKAPEIGLIKASYEGTDDFQGFEMNITSLKISDQYSSSEANFSDSESVRRLGELNDTLLYNYSASDRIYDVRLDFNIIYRNNSSVIYSRNASHVFTDVNFSERDVHLVINASEGEESENYDQDGDEGVQDQDDSSNEEDGSAEEDDDPDPDGDRTHGEEDEKINDLRVNDEFRSPDIRVYGLNEE